MRQAARIKAETRRATTTPNEIRDVDAATRAALDERLEEVCMSAAMEELEANGQVQAGEALRPLWLGVLKKLWPGGAMCDLKRDYKVADRVHSAACKAPPSNRTAKQADAAQRRADAKQESGSRGRSAQASCCQAQGCGVPGQVHQRYRGHEA